MFGIEYTYCLVDFDGGKTYYYRTENNKVAAGSRVIVPVGKYDAWKVATVVSVNTYKQSTAPYPLRKTKVITCPAGKNAERKVEKHNKRIIRELQKKQTLKDGRQELLWIDCIEEMNALFED